MIIGLVIVRTILLFHNCDLAHRIADRKDSSILDDRLN